jgi:PAS domain S-box-containing protein
MNSLALPIAMAETLLVNSLAGILVYEGHSGNCVLANQAVADMLGRSIEALRLQKFRALAFWRRAGLDDLAEAVLCDGLSQHHQVTLPADFGKIVSLDCFISRFDFEGRSHLMFIVTDITEREQAQTKLARERALLRCLIDSVSDLIFINDRVNRAIQGADDLEAMMRDLLDAVLSIFDCDRTFLLHPCDPESPTWNIPMERHKPGYPDVGELRIEMSMDPQVAGTLRSLLNSDGPVKFGPGTDHRQQPEVSERFKSKSCMSMALFPRVGNPWQFGIHQCSHARVWTAEEEKLFQEIGRRLEDGLTSMLAYRDLNQQLHFLQQLLDSIPIPVYYKDPEGLYLGCNALFETFTGLARKDIVGKTVHQVVPKERADKHHGVDLALLGQPGMQTYEVSGTYKDGKHHDVIFNKATFVDANNCVAGTVGALMDITERKQAERERLANLKFFENMDRVNRAIQGADDLEAMMRDLLDVVLAVFDCDRTFLLYPCDPEAPTWSVPMERNKPEYPGVWDLKMEMPMDPQVAETLQILLAEDGPVAFGPGMPHALPADVSEQFGIQAFMSMAVYPKTGNSWEFGIHQCACARTWTAEEKRLFQEIGRRLTDGLSTMLAEKALRESEKKLREAARIAHMGYWECDYVAQSIVLSEEARKIFGLPPHHGLPELSEWHAQWVKLIHPEDRHRAAQAAAALAGGPPYNVNYRVVRPDGEVRYVHSYAEVTKDASDSPLRMFGTMRDITVQKRMELELAGYREHLEEQVKKRTAELEERQEQIIKLNQDLLNRAAVLEAANKELDAFTYSVSHGLRAPLRHIDGFVELLQKRAGTTLDEKSRHFMDTIADAAQKMGSLIDDLLAFSRMGREAMSLRQVDLGTLVGDVIRELEPEAVGRNIVWRTGDLPAVKGDASMLRIVLCNLISNAVKFTRSNKQARIEVGCQPRAKENIIFVRDNGVGFDPAHAGKLFGVFQRLHHKDEFEGTGVGLAIVQRIVTRHGGRSWAEGQVGRGATFYFSLPWFDKGAH